MPELTEIKGVGPVLAKACTENGYTGVEKLAIAAPEELVVVPGISIVKAKLLITAAKALQNGALSSTPEASLADTEQKEIAAKKDKASDKEKKKKKKSKKKNEKKNKKSKKKPKKKRKKS